ncbi:hypothetical protein XBJ2_70001 [Xenorhabdus bovienii str. Jollieti]|uniref:Uncharacterized protein n=1 Tax=Xenorhabdus bovienii (strain SS-2004) TaxID=406818 RepID=D3UYJ5_XENBS|nr:hypothetical protein [Xenorhabdus bovienii]CBJ79373.1 hypothetical protein XBJ1_0222 [Xenorhabdus bovienii SS-2004]CDH30283.1 hypothetical protein XBJ2_70001 [Xenorhabdus bovienii str. Jollieti]
MRIDSINFKPLPIDFEIESIEVTNFTSQHSLPGDGNSAYEYRAKIINKTNGKKISNYSFDPKQVNWSREPKRSPKLVDEKDLVLFDPEFTTNSEGYLTIKLKSLVGIKNIEVNLNITSPHGDVSKNAKLVDFEVSPQPAGLFMYREGKKDTINLFTKEQERPYNAVGTLHNGELRTKDNKLLSNSENGKLVKVHDYEYDDPDGILSYNNKHDPNFAFENVGKATVKALVQTLNRDNEVVYERLYAYNFNILRLFTAIDQMNDPYVPGISNISCESDNKMGGKTPKLSDVIGPKTLSDEFRNAFSWGLFHRVQLPHDIDKKDFAKFAIIDENAPPNNPYAPYSIYDAVHGNIIDPTNSNVLLICLWKQGG